MIRFIPIKMDIGSRSMECAVLEDGIIRETREAETGFNPIGQAKKLILSTSEKGKKVK